MGGKLMGDIGSTGKLRHCLRLRAFDTANSGRSASLPRIYLRREERVQQSFVAQTERLGIGLFNWFSPRTAA